MTIKRGRLSSTMTEGRKPYNRKEALAYIEKHTKYRVDASMGCFAINVKLWSYRFANQDEREKTFDLVQGSGEFWEFYIDWPSVHAFDQKHNVSVSWAGRNAGWACLVDQSGSRSIYEPDEVEDSPLFTQRYMAACKKMSDQVIHWRTEAINDMFKRHSQYVPLPMLQFILEHMSHFQAVRADGQLDVLSSNLEKLPHAPNRSDENSGWESFLLLKNCFFEIDRQYPMPKRTSPYDMWPTQNLLETAHVLWDFNHMIDGLADFVVQYAMEAQDASQPEV